MSILNFPSDLVTVADVLKDLNEADTQGELEQIYVIGFTKNNKSVAWASGDTKSLGIAALKFQALALRHCTTLFDDEL